MFKGKFAAVWLALAVIGGFAVLQLFVGLAVESSSAIALLILFILAILIGPYIVGTLAHRRSERLERLAAELTRRLDDLQLITEVQGAELTALRRQVAGEDGTVAADAAFAQVAEPAPETATATEDAELDAGFDTAEQGPPPPQAPGGWRGLTKGGWERQFGAVLPVWIGGIAIAFAGFFLVKYSIENELVGPEMRVVLGALLGVALMVGARWVSARTAGTSDHRIAQALAGAGIATLYVSAYAATALYSLVPPVIGFLAMAAITALAVVLALLHGPAIALLGMVGGFLTPALISSGEPSAMVLFTYLYFVFAALMIVIRQRGWWVLAWPALIFVFGWALVWIFSGSAIEGENLWLGLFLVAVAATIIAASRDRYRSETESLTSWRQLFSLRNRSLALNVLSVAGSMALMALLAYNAAFGLIDWMLFGVLAVGAVALAFFDPRLYGFAPWAAMAINAVMLAGWTPHADGDLTFVLCAFGALYVTSGFLLLSSSATPLLWAALSASAALGYFLIAFFRIGLAEPVAAQPQIAPIDIPPLREPVEPLVEGVKAVAASVSHVWAMLAMALALLFLGAALWAAKRFPASVVKERILAVYALATTAFLALTFFIELDREFLSVAIAAELLAVAWVATRTQIGTLRPIAGLLGLTFAFLLVPQILLLIQLAFYSVLGVEWRLQESIPIVDYPTFQLALPAALFLGAGYVLRRMSDGLLVRTLEFASLALIALWGFYTTAQLFHPGENVLFAKASFLERGVITNVLFAFGLGCLVIARWFGRIAFFQSGALIAGIALFRVVYFDLITKNPLWFGGEVPGVTPLDALTVAYILPILWTWLAAAEIERQSADPRFLRIARMARPLTLVFAFAWISLEIRRFYQGPVLDGLTMTDAEFYSYSVAWLAFGIALLFYGTLKGSQLLRYASLAVILLTVSKVFLLDAGNLTGLYRVFSFLGLGLSLLAISYFYGRFVFGGQAGNPEEPQLSTEPNA